MDTPQKLNHSSPIVQRVFRFRERLSWHDTTTEKGPPLSATRSVSADNAYTRTRYQWQMWQKSDFSAYTEDGPEHRCKGMRPPLSPGREGDAIEVQGVPVLSQGISS